MMRIRSLLAVVLLVLAVSPVEAESDGLHEILGGATLSNGDFLRIRAYSFSSGVTFFLTGKGAGSLTFVPNAGSEVQVVPVCYGINESSGDHRLIGVGYGSDRKTYTFIIWDLASGDRAGVWGAAGLDPNCGEILGYPLSVQSGGFTIRDIV